MRHIMTSLCLGSAMVLSACGGQDTAELDAAFKAVNVIDESGLNDIMLNSPDPNEAVRYFERATAENPDRVDSRAATQRRWCARARRRRRIRSGRRSCPAPT